MQQPFRDDPDRRLLREKDDIFYTTERDLKPLTKIQRAHPWNSGGVIVDYNQMNYKTLYSQTFSKERLDNYYGNGDMRPIRKTVQDKLANSEQAPEIQTSGAKMKEIVNVHNLSKYAQYGKDVKMNVSDFGSTLPRHPKDHGTFYNVTSYHAAFSRPLKTAGAISTCSFQNPKDSRPAGLPKERSFTDQGMRLTSCLTGEKYRESEDPKDSTRAQRAWLPRTDSSLRFAEQNLTQFKSLTRGKSVGLPSTYRSMITQVNPIDNANSLPMESTEMI